MRIERNAPAKINLTLEVLGRRADGYHEVASVMHTLSLHDTLALELPNAPLIDASQGEIVVVGEETPSSSFPRAQGEPEGGGIDSIPTDTRNLIWKAVEAFVKSSAHCHPVREWGADSVLWERGQEGAGRGWRAQLIKRIPAQAGLGGGSSDAAAALAILADWARRWKTAQPNLYSIASKLGADVAFFVGKGAGGAS
ncbi:MAG: 4-(cytidine 5'-diphospho)-2-C-methyl-D-erythritol kinase, partial [Fimbriimonadales bacterium]